MDFVLKELKSPWKTLLFFPMGTSLGKIFKLYIHDQKQTCTRAWQFFCSYRQLPLPRLYLMIYWLEYNCICIEYNCNLEINFIYLWWFLSLKPGKPYGRRSLVGCSPWDHWESDTTHRLHFHFSLSHIGEGNGNPLQCSCLENPRDRGAWWAAIYGVTQSRTRLKWLSSSSSMRIGKFLNVQKWSF